MDRLKAVAEVSVARATGFGALAIFCTMIGLSGTPILALKVGAILALVGASVLLLKAQLAQRRPYDRTELWLMLSPADRPQPGYAQFMIGSVLRQTFIQFAVYHAIAAAIMAGLAFMLWVIGSATRIDF